MQNRRVRLACLSLLFLAGCGSSSAIVVDGFPIRSENWHYTMRTLEPFARADLQCGYPPLSFRMLMRSGAFPSDVVVEGCGRAHRYLRIGYRWFNVLDPVGRAEAQGTFHDVERRRDERRRRQAAQMMMHQ